MACYEDPSNYGVVGNRSNPTNQRHGSRAAILEKGKELFPESRLRYNRSRGKMCVGPVVILEGGVARGVGELTLLRFLDGNTCQRQ